MIYRSKYFVIKYLFVREKILEFHTRIKHLAIEDMLADPLINGLTVRTFQRHITNMGLAKSFDILN